MPKPIHSRSGFALVVTLSMMLLLALMVVGLLSLSTITLRTSSKGDARRVAQANARMALTMALGELQKYAGPDQRVTGSSSLAGEAIANPNWTGVWSTLKDDTEPVWLVSGNEAVPVGDLDELMTLPASYFKAEQEVRNGSMELFSGGDGNGGDKDAKKVRVPAVDVKDGSSMIGRYAWWVSDEGCKARVNVQAPDTAPVNNHERLARASVAQESGLDPLDSRFAMLDPIGGEVEKKRLISANTMALSLGDATVADDYFHDLTTGGYGLPVNVVRGGMKNDLSVAFDSSQERSGLAGEIMGANPAASQIGGATVYQFNQVRDQRRFYLAPPLSGGGRYPLGPNWGILYNYAKLWDGTRRGSIKFTAMNPKPESDLRKNNWPPYRNIDQNTWARDIQHTNSPVAPVISMLQMGFRMSAKEKILKPATGGQPAETGYQMQLQMKPVVGIWNPYNVKIEAITYRFDWALYPYLRIGIDTPDGNKYRPRIWMRENWMEGNGSTTDGSLNRWFRLETEAIDLEPGEMRLFSVESRTEMSQVNRLVPSWNEEGAFTFDLKWSAFHGEELAGKDIIVPRGSVVWYGDLFLEDAQHPDTARQFGDTYTDGVSSSWITFKAAGNLSIHRISDIWQTATKSQRDGLKFQIPEQVISAAIRTGTPSPNMPVELIARTPYHVGTWRWFSRNSNDAEDSQDLRGMVDTNVRFAATNPAWDGSKISSRRSNQPFEGWYFISPFLGASYEDTYDNGPPGRGKIAEGQNEIPAFPEATRQNRRYRGFGGFSSSSSGQSHTILYDVPRAPLVSLGQFQHAQLSRYGYEPGFAFGNSYANPRIPPDQTLVENFNSISDFNMVDLSYVLNEVLWDDYFFSTVGQDYFAASGRAGIDSVLPFEQVAAGTKSLPNPRYTVRPQPGDSSFQKIIDGARVDASRALAARIAVEGAFNVNSTSKQAWKAVLASMADFEFPTVSRDGSRASWAQPTGIRFPRFGHVVAADGWESGDGPIDPDFWLGYRKLTEPELDELAGEMVEEVRKRGPFRSFADFVNRDPESSDPELQRKGALQAALDRSLNNDLLGEMGGTASTPPGRDFPEVIAGESEAGGFAGYLMQGDVLQSLAPVLQVRSDYFRIRTAGQATDSKGNVLATAYCEAYVQRTADFTDSSERPETAEAELKSEVNRNFGRRFAIVSFRWLSPKEI